MDLSLEQELGFRIYQSEEQVDDHLQKTINSSVTSNKRAMWPLDPVMKLYREIYRVGLSVLKLTPLYIKRDHM